MVLQEQLFRSRKLMCESAQDKLDLVDDLLNTMLSYDGNVQYKSVVEFDSQDENIVGFSVEATIDSSMYHMVSPNYDRAYWEFIDRLDDEIYRLTDKYFGDELQYQITVYFHKNADKVAKIAKPMIEKAMRVYSEHFGMPVLKFKIVEYIRRAELVIFIERNIEQGIRFNHVNFLTTLNNLYFKGREGIFDDFYITAIGSDIVNNANKIYESVVDGEVFCENCSWSWKLSEGGKDPYTCHKCGNENKNPHDS
jgi:hypothetical protein